MNQRIEKLAEQCRSLYRDGNGGYIEQFDEQKFAELIVRECMAMCKTAVGNADYNTGRLHCLNNIKEHFGVEE